MTPANEDDFPEIDVPLLPRQLKATGNQISDTLRAGWAVKGEQDKENADRILFDRAKDNLNREFPTFPAVYPSEAHFFEHIKQRCGTAPSTQVSNARDGFFSGICHLYIDTGWGGGMGGTGWLISPRCVITAGHNVHGGKGKNFYPAVYVFAGRNGINDKPFLMKKVSNKQLRVSRGWSSFGKLSDDYGAIILSNDIRSPHNNSTPNILQLALPAEEIPPGEAVLVTGYPTSRPRGTQWCCLGRAENFRHQQVSYKANTEDGFSGGPIVLRRSLTVVGVHNYGGCPVYGTGLTTSVRRDLWLWAQESEKQSRE